ncbi:hypothetical protein [Leifsonia shinshuensis]|uniref:hypothetical protein n=1 Tax=Leifsonia shinshuensis TaxID=150026 RepID=UPI0028624700|nr:hypothetical protein [Leifsonia shinshuensis]MDR6971564.1 hypothetical protein [Leifsonia shinshuensis]
MTDDEQSFYVTMSGDGTRRGELQDPAAVTVHVDPAVVGGEKGHAMFVAAIEQQRTALSRYSDALQAAAADVTAPAVQETATALHEALQFLPIAHMAYAGVGFPTARTDESAPTASVLPPARGEARLGVHPDMLTAIQGDQSQRWHLAGEESLPLAIEIALATDPDPVVRASLLVGSSMSRTGVLLMEQRETEADLLLLLAQQSYASPDRKFPLVLADLAPRELEGLYELLGLDDACAWSIGPSARA